MYTHTHTHTHMQHTVFTELAPACNILVLFVLCQWLEVPYDALMSRTKNRPLVRQFIRYVSQPNMVHSRMPCSVL